MGGAGATATGPLRSRLLAASALPPWARLLGGVATLTLLLLLVYGRGYVGYDAGFALVWGDDLIHGRLPNFELPFCPTPHPLANVAGAALAPLEGARWEALALLSTVSLAALGAGAFALGRRLFGTGAGVAFALVLLTRPLIVDETYEALIDIPFLAFVLWAAAVDARRPRAGYGPLALLTLAGLLRPEGWLLALAYVAWLAPQAGRAQLARYAAVAVSAPLAWALFDLVVTGDPLWSLHGTQDLAERLGRPREAETALRAAPEYLRDAVGLPVALAGLAGAVGALWAFYERAVVPAALLGLGLLGFIALGVVQLPLLARYLLVPELMLMLFAGFAVAGWLMLDAGDRRRAPWALIGLAAAAWIAAHYGVEDRPALERLADRSETRRQLERSLEATAGRADVRAASRSCPVVAVASTRQVAVLAVGLERRIGSFRAVPRRAPAMLVNPSPAAVERWNATTAPGGATLDRLPSPPWPLVHEGRDWSVRAACAPELGA